MNLLRTGISRYSFVSARFFSISYCALSSPKVAVVLSGSGVYDGSEIHEASAILVHLTRENAQPLVYAPDIDQLHVINHCKGEPMEGEKRNIMVESARIARGKIQPLKDLDADSHDALVFPGGFGVAKNLSTFAVDGDKCKVNPEVERIIKEFHAAKKPIGFCCIAPVLAARVLGKVELTLGQDKDDGSGKWPYTGATEAVKSWGAIHHNKNVNDVVVDRSNLIVTTPAFMYDTPFFHQIYDGIGEMIKSLLGLIRNK
ncbi:glutamine amidotransferase-like class 1 domain-containing protein 3, mitochondrial [Tachypleus tridentatus]|uniref:glutamine amidotransferase-like class 1 domain-containing protein 3, mitochondrial n=1 Tax=Tachypleus tridentatus TaxID=6853 RepID=UPI003FD0CAD7